jgi:hypothetical protein
MKKSINRGHSVRNMASLPIAGSRPLAANDGSQTIHIF